MSNFYRAIESCHCLKQLKYVFQEMALANEYHSCEIILPAEKYIIHAGDIVIDRSIEITRQIKYGKKLKPLKYWIEQEHWGSFKRFY